MLGAPSIDPPPSWVPSSTQHQNSNLRVAEAPVSVLGRNNGDSHASSFPHAALRLEHNQRSGVDCCPTPGSSSCSGSTGDPSTSGLQSLSQTVMTSSSAVPSRRVRINFRLPANKAQRMKRIASHLPQTFRRLGVTAVQVGKDALPISVTDVSMSAVASLRIEEPNPRPEPSAEITDSRTVHGPGGVGFVSTTTPQNADGAPLAQSVQGRTAMNNNSPLLVNLLSSQQQQQQQGVPPQCSVSATNPRPFSPYAYGPQTPHSSASSTIEQQQMTAMQQQHQMQAERQRIMLHQQQQAQLQAMAHQQGQLPQAGMSQQHQSTGVATSGSVPSTSGPIAYFVPSSAPNGSSAHRQGPAQMSFPTSGQTMFSAQQRMPGFNAQVAQVPVGSGAPPFGQIAEEPVAPPPKKKRKPTKKQQKEAELAQQNAQQQFMAERLMHPQHMPPGGMVPHGYPQVPPGYPQPAHVQSFSYPTGSAPHPQQMWHHQQQMQQRMMYQQQHPPGNQSGQPWPPQRTPVPYPSSAGIADGPASIHPPVAQRTSGEFSQDGASPSTPQQFSGPGHSNSNTPGTATFGRTDSRGNVFNYNQASTSSAENPVDKLWNSHDEHVGLGDLGDLDDIEPMNELSGSSSLLTDSTLLEGPSKSSQGEKPLTSTPNGDRIVAESSIASVMDMVSKSTSQPSQSVPLSSQNVQSQHSGPLKRRMSNAQIAANIVAVAEQQQMHNELRIGQLMTSNVNTPLPPSISAPNLVTSSGGCSVSEQSRVQSHVGVARSKGTENGGSRLTNGHEQANNQLPNGSRKVPSSEDGTDERIGQLVKSLLAEEQRKKDNESKVKQQRKGRRKADVSKEGSPREDEDLNIFDGGRSRSGTGSTVQAAANAFHHTLARQNLLKHSHIQPKQ